jgi:hypothetical protein
VTSGPELSDARLVGQERVVALVSTLPLGLAGALSMWAATHEGRGDALPIAVALASLAGLLAIRLAQRHLGRVYEGEDGLVVQTLLGRRLVVRWADIGGARVGLTPWRLPSRHPGYLRLRLQTPYPIVGRWVTTIASDREAALAASARVAERVRRAVERPERSA